MGFKYLQLPTGKLSSPGKLSGGFVRPKLSGDNFLGVGERYQILKNLNVNIWFCRKRSKKCLWSRMVFIRGEARGFIFSVLPGR